MSANVIIIGNLVAFGYEVEPSKKSKSKKRTAANHKVKSVKKSLVVSISRPFIKKGDKNLNGIWIIEVEKAPYLMRYLFAKRRMFMKSIQYRNPAGKLYEHKFKAKPEIIPALNGTLLVKGKFNVDPKRGIIG